MILSNLLLTTRQKFQFKILLILFVGFTVWACSGDDGVVDSTPDNVQIDTHTEGEGTVSMKDVVTVGEEIEILAEPHDGWIFVRWEGDLTGTNNPVTVTVDSDMEITAVFERREYPLNLEIEGEGTVNETVVEEPSTVDYEYETIVELEAVAATGWEFSQWQEDLEGNENPVTLEIDSETNVTAVFEQLEYELNIDTVGQGKVIADPDKDVYNHGEEVTLTAEPDEGWGLAGWQGDLSGDDLTVTVIMDDDRQITAEFVELEEVELTIAIEGEGDIIREPDSLIFYEGEEVTLKAEPDDDWRFALWTGDIITDEDPLTFTIEENMSLTAYFENNDFAGGLGTSIHPFEIETIEQLDDVRDYLDAYFIQTADIDASDTHNWGGGGFEPIGDGIESFIGEYDGNGYAIEQIFIDRPGVNEVGLFGVTEDALLENITMTGAVVNGNNVVGGLVGVNNGEVDGSHVAGEVTGGEDTGGLIGENSGDVTGSSVDVIVTGNRRTGGLIGENEGQVSDSYAEGEVTGDERTGGLIGINSGAITGSWFDGEVSGSEETGGLTGMNSGEITESYSAGQVTGDDEDTGGLIAGNSGTITNSHSTANVTGGSRYTGGFVGYLSTETAVIQDSYSTGNVSSNGQSVGGFAGYHSNGEINDSYSTGEVTGDNNTGGFAGYLATNGVINTSYSSGVVTGNTNTGGFVGYRVGDIQSGYWDTEASKQSDGEGYAGISPIDLEGLTTAEMSGTEAETNMDGLNFDQTWRAVTDSYPELVWQEE